MYVTRINAKEPKSKEIHEEDQKTTSKKKKK